MSELPSLAPEDFVCLKCAVSYSDTSVEEALSRISLMPHQIRNAVSRVPEQSMRQRPDASTWSPIEYLCHIRDVLASATIRLYRSQREDAPTIEPMFNDLRAARFGYRHRDPIEVISEIDDNAQGFCNEAARVPPAGWTRTFTRLPGESRTARWLVRQTMHEMIHHLVDIDEISRRIVSGEAPPPG